MCRASASEANFAKLILIWKLIANIKNVHIRLLDNLVYAVVKRLDRPVDKIIQSSSYLQFFYTLVDITKDLKCTRIWFWICTISQPIDRTFIGNLSTRTLGRCVRWHRRIAPLLLESVIYFACQLFYYCGWTNNKILLKMRLFETWHRKILTLQLHWIYSMSEILQLRARVLTLVIQLWHRSQADIRHYVKYLILRETCYEPS